MRRSVGWRIPCLEKSSLMAAILATVALPVTEALASRADDHQGGYRASAYHRGYRTGHRRGYGVHYYRPVNVGGPSAAAPTIWPDLGSVIYGYPYGTPCYRYNDWDYERVC
jgi:hypothetical protein